MSLNNSTRALVFQSTAAEVESQALQASLAGNQAEARSLYAQALDVVPSDGYADTAAQRSSIIRNLGFTYVREAIATDDVELVWSARAYIGQAIEETADLVSGRTGTELRFKQLGRTGTYKRARRELFSEHAASLGLLARAATAAEVAFKPSEQTQSDRLRYGYAHDFARLGLNGYIRVSNAMNGARDERRAGLRRLPHTAVCLARAAFGVVWSVKNDRGNLSPAIWTIASRLPALRTTASASASVLERP